MHTYDFLGQSSLVGGLTFDRVGFEAVVAEAGATPQGDGQWVWRLSTGEVLISALNEMGGIVGFDVRVPLRDRVDLVLETLDRGSALAAAHGLQFVDPQLSRAVTQNDAPAVEESYLRVARYAGAYVEGPVAAAAEPAGFSWPVKVTLAVIVFVATLYFAFQTVT